MYEQEAKSPLGGALERDDGGGVEVMRNPTVGAAFYRPAGPGSRAWRRLNNDQQQVVAHVQSLAIQRDHIDQEIDEHIAAAREMGVSWDVLGWSCGMTGEGARRRYGEQQP